MTYRVGRHQPQNVYRDDAYIGVMFTAEDAALVVEALNAMARPSLVVELDPRINTAEGQEAFREELKEQLRRRGEELKEQLRRRGAVI